MGNGKSIVGFIAFAAVAACSGGSGSTGGKGGGTSATSSGSASSGSSGIGSSSSGTTTGMSSSGGMAKPVVLADQQNGIVAIAADGTNVYWIAENAATWNYQSPTGTIGAVPVGGGAVKTLASKVVAFQIGATGGHVYYAGQVGGSGATGSDGNVVAIPAGGGAPTTLAKATQTWQVMAVSSDGVFLLEGPGGAVDQVPLAGGAVKALLPAKAGDLFTALAVDTSHVFFANYPSSKGGIQTIPLAGATTATTVVSGLTGPAPIAADGSYVYYFDGMGTAQALKKVPVGGGTPTALTQNGGASPADWDVSGPVSIAVDATNVYWANGGNARIMSVPVGGGSAVNLALGVSVVAMAIDGQNVYWANGGQGTSSTSVFGTINKIPK